jgi:hypothetical protein
MALIWSWSTNKTNKAQAPSFVFLRHKPEFGSRGKKNGFGAQLLWISLSPFALI